MGVWEEEHSGRAGARWPGGAGAAVRGGGRRLPKGTPLPASAGGEPVTGCGVPRLCSCVALSTPRLTRLPARGCLPAPRACLVLLPFVHGIW